MKAADLPAVVGAGIFGILLLSYAYNAAVLMLSLSLASILLCTAPIFVLILGRIIFGGEDHENQDHLHDSRLFGMRYDVRPVGNGRDFVEHGWHHYRNCISCGQRYVYDSFEGGHIEGIRSVYHISVFLPVYRHNIDTDLRISGQGQTILKQNLLWQHLYTGDIC